MRDSEIFTHARLLRYLSDWLHHLDPSPFSDIIPPATCSSLMVEVWTSNSQDAKTNDSLRDASILALRMNEIDAINNVHNHLETGPSEVAWRTRA
jgi:hypothetical protein